MHCKVGILDTRPGPSTNADVGYRDLFLPLLNAYIKWA